MGRDDDGSALQSPRGGGTHRGRGEEPDRAGERATTEGGRDRRNRDIHTPGNTIQKLVIKIVRLSLPRRCKAYSML